jgi:uncharacterized membrane protein
VEFWRLLAHNHWITINLFGFKIRLCSRCSGYAMGFASFTLLAKWFRIKPDSLNILPALIVFILLVLPLIYDWITQSWGLRESNNAIRLLTGTLMGLGIGFFSELSIEIQLKRMVFVSVAILILIIGLKNSFRPNNEITCC